MKFFNDMQYERLGRLCRETGVRRLDLFGSAVHGTFDVSVSDLDFLVEFDSKEVEGAADRYFGLIVGKCG